LKKDYKDEITLKEACELAIKVLSKTVDSSNLNSEKLEFATVSLGPQGVVRRIWADTDVNTLIKLTGVLEKPDEE
ncbi:hypothetical protein OXX69_011162, partial [Metschnikowia pulcherrima]